MPCDLWVMSGHVGVSHGPTRTPMSPVISAAAAPPSQLLHSVPPRGVTAWSQIWSPGTHRNCRRDDRPVAGSRAALTRPVCCACSPLT